MRRNRFDLLVAAVAMTAVVSCFDLPQEQHTSFETMTLTRQDVEVPSSWSATIVGKNDVTITPQTSGQLMQKCVQEGQRVKKGQVLFVIDQRQAKLALATMQANLMAAEAQLSTAHLEYESNQNLFDKQIISSYLLNASKNDYERAKAAVEQAKAAVADAEVNLEYCTVTSPVDGLVGRLPNNPGDQVSPASVLTTISGTTEMIAQSAITENEIHEILNNRDGDLESALKLLPPVTLILKDGSVYEHNGRVESISGAIDQYTGSVVCRSLFPNPDGKLYSGMQGTIQMMFPYEGVIIVPLNAVVRIQDKTMVYRVKDNKAESVMVDIVENGKVAALLSGVEAGDVIVTTGANNVYDGQQVIFPEESDK